MTKYEEAMNALGELPAYLRRTYNITLTPDMIDECLDIIDKEHTLLTTKINELREGRIDYEQHGSRKD